MAIIIGLVIKAAVVINQLSAVGNQLLATGGHQAFG
jgi:hypothetical protein